MLMSGLPEGQWGRLCRFPDDSIFTEGLRLVVNTLSFSHKTKCHHFVRLNSQVWNLYIVSAILISADRRLKGSKQDEHFSSTFWWLGIEDSPLHKDDWLEVMSNLFCSNAWMISTALLILRPDSSSRHLHHFFRATHFSHNPIKLRASPGCLSHFRATPFHCERLNRQPAPLKWMADFSDGGNDQTASCQPTGPSNMLGS